MIKPNAGQVVPGSSNLQTMERNTGLTSLSNLNRSMMIRPRTPYTPPVDNSLPYDLPFGLGE